MRSVLSKLRVLAVPVLIGAMLPIVALSQSTADAFEVGTAAWTGGTAATATSTQASGLVVTSTVAGLSPHNGQSTIAARGATSAMFTPSVATTTPTKVISTNVTGCTYATGVCANRGTWTLSFSQPVTNPVIDFTGFGGQRTTGGDQARFSAVPVLTGSSPSGATLGAPSAGSTNLKVTGGTTVDRNNAYADVSCVSTADSGSQDFAGCGSVPVVGTVTSLTFRIDARIAFVKGNPADLIDSGQQDTWEFTVSTDEDFGDAPASYDVGQAAVSTVGDLHLGTAIDADNTSVLNATTSPNAVAAGANNNGANGDGTDEDAFSSLPDVPASGSYALTVPLSGASKAGQVCGWIDFDKGGTFGTGNEQACASFAAGATSANLSWTVPNGTVAGNTYARFRAAYGTVAGPTGQADSGEVEDYRLALVGAPPNPPFDCTSGLVYSVANGVLYGVNPANGTTTAAGNFGAGINALGMTANGGAAYGLTSQSGLTVTILRLDAATGAVTSFTGTGNNSVLFYVAGAINPVNGIYYYSAIASGGVATIFAFDTNTNTNIGKVGTTTLAYSASSSAPNGDMAFDSNGNLYFISTGTATSGLTRINAANVPTAAGSATMANVQMGTTGGGDGIAFSSNGGLYVQSTTGTSMFKVDPNTGATSGTVSLTFSGGGVGSDLASCSTPPTLTVQKNVVSRVVNTNQFTLGIAAPGTSADVTATTTGTATGVQPVKAGPVLAVVGSTYTLNEIAAGTTNLANYASTYQCVDTNNSNNVVASGSTTSFDLVYPAPAAGENGPNIVCTFTNGPPAPAITLTKTHGAINDLDANGTDAGDTVAYSFLVKNTGNTTLNTVGVADPMVGPVSCPVSTLAPNASTTCTKTYTLTQADINAGVVNNTATGSGTSPAGTTVQATDSNTLSLVNLGPLDCTTGTIYALQRGTQTIGTGTSGIYAIKTNALGGAITPTLVATSPTTGTAAGAGFANGLAIAKGGTDAYFVDQNVTTTGVNGTTIFRYNAVTGTWTGYPGATLAAGSSVVAGAIDPSTGIYYYADFPATSNAPSQLITIYGFDTNTNTPIAGVIATTTLPEPYVAGTNANGDFSFDAQGNLYIASSMSTGAALGVVKAPLPTTGSVNGASLTTTTLQNYTLPGGTNYNGIAFDNNGRLYVESSAGTATTLFAENPNTGATLSTSTYNAATGGAFNDLAACSANPTLSLQKDIVGRAAAGDQFGLAITGGSITSGNTATTAGATTGVQSAVAGPVVAVSGTTYTMTESAAAGTVLANYTIVYDFTVTNTGTVVIDDVKVDDPKLDAAGVAISCPKDTLTPGETMVCTSDPYTITSADATHGSVDNVATTTGTTPHHPVHSPPSTAIVQTHIPGELPNTGAGFTWWMPIVGLGMMAAGFGLVFARPRRREERA